MERALIQSDETAERPQASSVAEWQALADAVREGNPFYHPALLRPALDHLDPQAQVRVMEARKDGVLIGLMPVIARSRHSRYPVRNVSNWVHDQCFFGAPLLREGQEVAAWADLLAQLDRAPWAGHFLHLIRLDRDGMAAEALRECCAREKRPMRTIDLYERAMLRSDLDAETYWTTHVRSKKRKEIRRLLNRLADHGAVTHHRLERGQDVAGWTRDFLMLEASGWKGQEGTALDSAPGTRAYFSEILAHAAEQDMLDMLRIDVDDRVIAMLVNFRHGRGAHSYKIAFDEDFARYSPGILIEIDNLRTVLGDGPAQAARRLDWMDSCAAPDHPMIDGLWAERRAIAQFRVALGGPGATGLVRRAAFAATSLAETAIRSIRKEKS
ncbi:MAG: GNAT family N-acetyltransferase [Sphingobium sp.]